ncbi:class I SAM-dependent methyltransferase [Pedococcus sp. KACC 23699]|uniref:Class I SAM-dependent methyltransferase n=1 Tax=Pedococcus sp. KACC 23699 TaxID=3149228 RepID=A0AAU7JW94_9MICO
MNQEQIKSFWNDHPCGDHIVGGLHQRFDDDYERFFAAYDAWRYDQESHIPAMLDRVDWRGKRVLEIGLGQGAESEQLIRRGALWSGLDLTDESVDRVRTRLAARALPYEDLRQGSVLDIPWADDSFDLVFSHGVLHHVPDVHRAQAEIHRVLRPGGALVAMLYARHSLNYQVSIRLVRRAALAAAYPLRHSGRLARAPMLRQHLDNAERVGLRHYLALDTFTHRSTDGPLNPFARVYSTQDARRDFPSFELVAASKCYLHAPPLPVRRLSLSGRRMGWHLWVRLDARPESTPAQGVPAETAWTDEFGEVSL